MQYETNSGLSEPISARSAVRRGLSALLVVSLVLGSVAASSVVYVYGAQLVATSLPAMLVGWVASIGVAVALPFLVVRAVSELLTALGL